VTASVVSLPIPPVIKSVTVRCTPEAAFRAFTRDIGRWYPLALYSVRPAVDCRLEPGAGGRFYEIDAAGVETPWGHVRVWQPPERLVIAWHARTGEDEAQEVAVTFRRVTGGTEVELVHSGWERLKVEAAEWRDRYDNGWVEVFERRFKAFADAAGENIE
jgi:uncharacterized protein YndB with AHSA1/START domain